MRQDIIITLATGILSDYCEVLVTGAVLPQQADLSWGLSHPLRFGEEAGYHVVFVTGRLSPARSQPPPMRNMRVATNQATRAAATAATATAAVLANVGSKSLSTVTTPKFTVALKPTTATA